MSATEVLSRLSALSALSALILVGCTAGGGSQHSNTEPDIQVVHITDAKNLVLPLDSYSLNSGDDYMVRRARNKLLADCLQQFGFSVAPPDLPPSSADQPNANRYLITDENKARAYGYHNPTPERPAEPKLPPEAQGVISGKGPRSVGGQEVPVDGCNGQVRRQLSGGGVVDMMFAQQLAMDSIHRIEKDSRVIRKVDEWAACMKTAGFDYRNPHDANNDPAWSANPMSDKEKTVAVADAKCKGQVGLIDIEAAVETAYQKRLVEQNTDKLRAIKSDLQTLVRNANRTLG